MPLSMTDVQNQFVEIFGSPVDMIYRYTRAEAIEDGVLIDVTNDARKYGFNCPVAITSAVWQECITPSEHCRSRGQSEEGRLHDLFSILLWKTRASKGDPSLITFSVKFGRQVYGLKSLCHPGDNAERVITIMFLGED